MEQQNSNIEFVRENLHDVGTGTGTLWKVLFFKRKNGKNKQHGCCCSVNISYFCHAIKDQGKETQPLALLSSPAAVSSALESIYPTPPASQV